MVWAPMQTCVPPHTVPQQDLTCPVPHSKVQLTLEGPQPWKQSGCFPMREPLNYAHCILECHTATNSVGEKASWLGGTCLVLWRKNSEEPRSIVHFSPLGGVGLTLFVIHRHL